MPLLKSIPYHVGDIVRFRIHIEKPFIKNTYSSHAIYEKIADKWKLIVPINETDTEVTGVEFMRRGT